MISFSNIKIIFRKEFLQVMRDKSVLFTNFFIPLFGIPLYFIFALESITYMQSKKHAPLKDSTIFKISYQGFLEPSLRYMLETDNKIKLINETKSLPQDLIHKYLKSFKKYAYARKERKRLKFKIENNDIQIRSDKVFAAAKNSWQESLRELKANYKLKSDLHITVLKKDSYETAVYFFHLEENRLSNAAKIYLKRSSNHTLRSRSGI